MERVRAVALLVACVLYGGPGRVRGVPVWDDVFRRMDQRRMMSLFRKENRYVAFPGFHEPLGTGRADY